MEELFGDWVGKLRYFYFRETQLDGIPMVVARSGYSKQGGFELYLRDGSQGERLWEMIMEAGKKYDIAPTAPSTIERLECGLLSWGNDIFIENNPYEFSCGKYCQLDKKADFISRDSLRKIKAQGVTRQLVGLHIHGDRMPGNENRWPLRQNGELCGHVTSAIYSLRLKQNIAYAMVPVAYKEPGTRLTVETPLGEFEATVHSMPFI